jgi:hypothetical protein
LSGKLTAPSHKKNLAYFEIFEDTSEFDGLFGTTSTTEMECVLEVGMPGTRR